MVKGPLGLGTVNPSKLASLMFFSRIRDNNAEAPPLSSDTASDCAATRGIQAFSFLRL